MSLYERMTCRECDMSLYELMTCVECGHARHRHTRHHHSGNYQKCKVEGSNGRCTCLKFQERVDLARSLDEQLVTVQPWCTCEDPYFCNGDELKHTPDV